MRNCIYPGSFDPLTKGHADIIKRAADLFDKVHVAVLNNNEKRYMFDMDQRRVMAEKATADLANVNIVTWDGLLVELMEKLETRTIIRGLRSSADLELEQQLAVVNASLLKGTETLILLSKPEMQYVSSSIVKELISFGADVSHYVPAEIINMVNGRMTV